MADTATRTAVEAAEAAIREARVQYDIACGQAAEARDAAIAKATEDCQAVLDANAPEGLVVKISFKEGDDGD